MLADRIRILLHDNDVVQRFGASGRRKMEEKYGADLHYTTFMQVCSTLV
jgi:hypothetical protein